MDVTHTEAPVQEIKSKDPLIKLVYLLKRVTEDWSEKQLCCGGQQFNNAHLPLLMSIGANGISNNALATRLNVSKQAASKIIKILEADGLVKSEKNPADARGVMLYLTENGTKLYEHLKTQIVQLEEQHKKLVGVKNYEVAVEVMLKLIKFHEQQNSCSNH